DDEEGRLPAVAGRAGPVLRGEQFARPRPSGGLLVAPLERPVLRVLRVGPVSDRQYVGRVALGVAQVALLQRRRAAHGFPGARHTCGRWSGGPHATCRCRPRCGGSSSVVAGGSGTAWRGL